MTINKSDITQTRNGKTYTYKYSHTDEITVDGKIWVRHIWERVIPEGHWKPREETRLMDFEPTNRQAPPRPAALKRRKALSDYIKKYGGNA